MRSNKQVMAWRPGTDATMPEPTFQDCGVAAAACFGEAMRTASRERLSFHSRVMRCVSQAVIAGWSPGGSAMRHSAASG